MLSHQLTFNIIFSWLQAFQRMLLLLLFDFTRRSGGSAAANRASLGHSIEKAKPETVNG